MTRSKHRGFTLIELMITVAVLAIIAAVAFPSYRQHVVRSKRTAAQAVMMDMANLQQQFFVANRAYADKATLQASGYTVPAEVIADYSWDVNVDPSGSMPAFRIEFTAVGPQAPDGALTLDSHGMKTPAGKWK
jgi:type IV pilus assembly protein PilE